MPTVLPPNKVTHNPKRQQQCYSGDMACDTERRFWFTCGADGMWKDGVQCFAPGYCRTDNGVNLPLACGGFPTYDGKNDKCNDHCEGFDFLYCVGVSSRCVSPFSHPPFNPRLSSPNIPGKHTLTKKGPMAQPRLRTKMPEQHVQLERCKSPFPLISLLPSYSPNHHLILTSPPVRRMRSLPLHPSVRRRPARSRDAGPRQGVSNLLRSKSSEAFHVQTTDERAKMLDKVKHAYETCPPRVGGRGNFPLTSSLLV
jgi:hypothetical protein